MKLKDVVSELEAFAEKAWQNFEDKAEEIVQELVPLVDDAFTKLVKELGQLAVDTVLNLMTAAGGEMSGAEKHNLTVTTVVDAAERQGLAIIQTDAAALAKNAYLAVTGKAPVE